MPSSRRPLRAVASFVSFAFAVALRAQTMGTVATRDALVTGGLEVQGERARLLSNTGITAYDRTAVVALDRGGEALVCATSQFHLLHSGTGAGLLFGLDRGAFELRGPAQPQDVLLTPDIRFTLETSGTFALSLRVTSNGDTCVDNAGPAAPVLLLTDAFSSAAYRLLPGQHVLFEHGSLREVVDHERSACGCPAPLPTVQATATSSQDHPFPEAASVGLAPTSPVANTPPAGEKHTQVTTTFAYGTAPDGKPLPPPASIGLAPRPAVIVSTVPPPAPPPPDGVLHALGRLLHKLFHPTPKPTTNNQQPTTP